MGSYMTESLLPVTVNCSHVSAEGRGLVYLMSSPPRSMRKCEWDQSYKVPT